MLVAFDFDGTLSDSEMTVLLGERAGAAAEIAAVTERAMNGEIGYAESLRERVALLEDLPDREVQVALDEVVLRPGAADVVRRLNGAGVTTAVFTGGFQRGVETALVRDGVVVDAIVANRLAAGADGRLLGAVDGPLVEGTKDDALREFARLDGVEMADTIAVGDGANDLPMLRVAGLAVGFEPKDAVRPHCDVVVESMAELAALFEERGIV